MSCTQNSPCRCIKKCAPAPKPTCPETSAEGCLIACNDILPCEDSVGPCGQSGTFDLSTLNHNTSGCSDPVSLKYSIVDYDKNTFISASVDRNTGILTWVTTGSETAGRFGAICYTLTCESSCEDCFPLKSAGVFHVGVKDLCAVHNCQDCESCDPCTGNCIDNAVKLIVQDGTSSSNIQVNG